jgi:hypothetical protein
MTTHSHHLHDVWHGTDFFSDLEQSTAALTLDTLLTAPSMQSKQAVHYVSACMAAPVFVLQMQNPPQT